MNTNFDYAAESLRSLDWNRYFTVLFADKAHRPGLFALYTFNAEIARIRQLVSDPMPGEIRLQWWRDLLGGEGHGDVSANPNAAALKATVEAYKLPVPALEAMIDARVFDLYDDPMPSLNDLEGYAGETTSAVFQLASLILNNGEDAGTATVAGHAGVAYALTGLMRALPHHASRRQVFLPSDLLSRHNVDMETVFQGQSTPELSAALAELREHARHHMQRVRENLQDVPENVAAAYLPLALVDPYLVELEKSSDQALQSLSELSKLRRQWIYWRKARKGLSGL